MSIAEKLNTIAENEQRVYDAGQSKGYTNGEQAERSTFWEQYQKSGRRTEYIYAFYNTYWNDTIYNPIYPLTCSGKANDVYFYANVTDTKVDIDFTYVGATRVFGYSKLKTIRKLTVTENVTFLNWFVNCSALENITIEGTIGKDINFQYSPLSVDSMKSVISCLKNYAGTDSANTYTVKFTSDCWAALEASGTAPDGGTWNEYVGKLGWLT